MKVYRIVTMAIITAVCILGIVCGIICMVHFSGSFMNHGPRVPYETYGGDAYTGIQNATADEANRVDILLRYVEWRMNDCFFMAGVVMILVFGIATFIFLEKLIQAIIDCKKACVQKREEQLQKRLEYMEALKRLETAPEVTRIEDL